MRSDYLERENYKKLFAFMQYINAVAVRVTLETGLRIGDVVALTPQQLRGRTIYYTAQKTGKKGRAVISQDLANRLRAISGEHYIFPKRGDPLNHRARQTVWKDVVKAASALRASGLLGSENVTPHSARKTFAVEDAEHYGLLHTQKALQHRDKRTTKMYAFSDRYVGDNAVDLLIRRIMEIENKIDTLCEKFEKM